MHLLTNRSQPAISIAPPAPPSPAFCLPPKRPTVLRSVDLPSTRVRVSVHLLDAQKASLPPLDVWNPTCTSKLPNHFPSYCLHGANRPPHGLLTPQQLLHHLRVRGLVFLAGLWAP